MAAERFPVEAGHVMMFARSIGDPNSVYYDADAAAELTGGPIPAPPTFVQASAQFNPDYPLRPVIGAPWIGSGREPTGIVRDASASAGPDGASGGGTGLHAEQHFEYHRPLRVGDVLRSETRPGRHWEKQGKRAGKLLFSEMITEYRTTDGELVVTTRSVGVQTEKTVA
jgi:acyl dehydratase